jgi:alanyl-tRNA synthetase
MNLYHTDAYQKTFTAEVLSSERISEDRYHIVLSSTLFYPEGGGQPGDRGTIGEARILDTRKDSETIVHVSDRYLEPGSYPARLDWDHRFDYMQQHTGQHLLSAVLKKSWNIDTVSVHQGEAYTTIEFRSDTIDIDLLYEAARQAVWAIMQGAEVQSKIISSHELNEYELRRETAIEGEVRLLEIRGIDLVACGGVHVHNISELGMVMPLGIEKIRGNTRTFWKIGKRAFQDYAEKSRVTQLLGSRLSSELSKIPEYVENQQKNLRELEQELTAYRKQKAIDSARDIALKVQKGIQTVLLEKAGKDEIKHTAIELSKITEGPVFIYGELDGNAFPWAFVFVKNIDRSQLQNYLLEPLQAKGGGRAPLYQGSAENLDAIDELDFSML